MTPSFEQVATAIAGRLAQLLAAQVSVLNEQGSIVAMSSPAETSVSLHTIHSQVDVNALQIPMHFAGQTGALLIAQSAQSEAISLRPAQMLVELMLSQVTAIAQPDQHELKTNLFTICCAVPT